MGVLMCVLAAQMPLVDFRVSWLKALLWTAVGFVSSQVTPNLDSQTLT
jgi:hypothetical protein